MHLKIFISPILSLIENKMEESLYPQVSMRLFFRNPFDIPIASIEKKIKENFIKESL